MAYLVTVGTLPVVLRDRLGLTWSRRQERRLRRFRRLVRAAMALVIPPFRVAGAVFAAQWSLRLTEDSQLTSPSH